MKNLLTYIVLIGVFATLTWLVIEQGDHLVKTDKNTIPTNSSYVFADKAKPVVIDSSENIYHQFLTNIKYPLSILLLQVLIILFTSRIFGILFKGLDNKQLLAKL